MATGQARQADGGGFSNLEDRLGGIGLWPADAYTTLLSNPADGLSMLLMLLRSPKWVHRRCESVTFHDDRTVARRVSIDFTVPTLAPLVELTPDAPVRLIPLTLLRKKTLVHFDLRDHENNALPLLGLRQTQALTETMLAAWAAVLSGAPTPGTPGDKEISRCVRDIAHGTQDHLRSAIRTLKGTPSRSTFSHNQLYGNPCFSVVIDRLVDSFMLIVALGADVGVRRVIKFSYDEPLSLEYKSHETGVRGDGPGRLWAALGWEPMRIRFPTPAAENCQSYHFEVEAPAGVHIVEATMLAGRPSDRQVRPSFDQVGGGFPRANLHVADVPNGSLAQAQVSLRVARDGWLSTSVLACLATALVLFATWVSVARPRGNLESPEAILLTVTGAVATVLVKPYEHRMVTRMLSGVRVLTIAATSLPFLVTGLLLFGADWSWTPVTILALAISSGVLAISVCVTWLRAGQRVRRISPWEQGPRVDDLLSGDGRSRRQVFIGPPEYLSYEKAAAAEGYNRPATIVASSEGQHRESDLDDNRWSKDLEERMEQQLGDALSKLGVQVPSTAAPRSTGDAG